MQSPIKSTQSKVYSLYCPYTFDHIGYVTITLSYSTTLFLHSFLSFNFHFYYGCSFFIYDLLIYPQRLPPRFSLAVPLLFHLLPYLQPARPASEPASSAESTMAGSFCSRSHALLINLSFSMDGIRQKVHGALYCSSVNQSSHLKLHKLLVKQSVC